MTLLDGRPLQMVARFPLPPKRRAQSIFWHQVDSHECECVTIHGHCLEIVCPCKRHLGEVGW